MGSVRGSDQMSYLGRGTGERCDLSTLFDELVGFCWIWGTKRVIWHLYTECLPMFVTYI